MVSSIKNKILNVTIVASILFLLAVILIAEERASDQRAYEALAEQRSLQLVEESSTADLDKDLAYLNIQAKTPPEQLQEPETPLKNVAQQTELASVLPFIYTENKNREWLAINSDFMGWLQVPGSNIDYPFVRSKDNQDYLRRDFYGEYSEAGTLFMDYRNLGNFNDRHTLIYGHNMKNKSMFHSLTYYHDAGYFFENQLIQLSGLYDSKTYRIFSVYEISADDYAFTLEFTDDGEYLDYLNELSDLSIHSPGLDLDSSQRLLTLVTCSYGVNNGRTIVHAVEIAE